MTEYLEKVCLYLGKMSKYSYNLSEMPVSSITASIIYVGLKTTEQIYHQSHDSTLEDETVIYNPEYYLNLILDKLCLK